MVFPFLSSEDEEEEKEEKEEEEEEEEELLGMSLSAIESDEVEEDVAPEGVI